MTQTFALFGATGHVGQELVKILQEKAAEDNKFLLFTRGEIAALAKKFQTTDKVQVTQLPPGDSELAELLKTHQVETVFLCIPQLQVHQAASYTETLVTAWKQAGVKRVVKVGTGNPDKYEYGKRHIAAEKVIESAGLKLTVLQGGNFSSNPMWLGPAPPGAPYLLIDVFKAMSYLSYLGLGIFRSMGNIVSFWDKDVTIPFMDLRDMAEALAVVLLDAPQHESKVYKIYSDSVTTKDICNLYSQLLGRKLHILNMSEAEIRALLAMDGVEGELADILVEMFARFSEGVYQADETWNGFTKLTGKEPRTFEAFAKEQVDARVKPIRLFG